jgi:hypothetical protein
LFGFQCGPSEHSYRHNQSHVQRDQQHWHYQTHATIMGFLALFVALGSGDVAAVLVPEVPILLEGLSGTILLLLRQCIQKQKYAVVIGVEGAGNCGHCVRLECLTDTVSIHGTHYHQS